jgi:hypothetical protein
VSIASNNASFESVSETAEGETGGRVGSTAVQHKKKGDEVSLTIHHITLFLMLLAAPASVSRRGARSIARAL